jgi:hypothetical protein
MTVSILVGLVCQSCTDFGSDIPPIDSTISLDLWEELSPNQRTLQLRAATERIYGCSNFSIMYRLSVSTQLIQVDFLGIDLPPICLTALGPATATMNLGSLSNGSYQLILTSNGSVTGSQLIVSDDFFKVINPDGIQTKFRRTELLRVPPRTIWGLIGYRNIAMHPLVQSFLDSVQNLGAQRQDFTHGYYGYFEIDQSGNITFPIMIGYPQERSFIYQYAGDPLALRDIVQSYATSARDSMQIRLYTAKGDAFYSWELREDP